ncbi:hypothetical protein ACHAXM_001749 [Skeletonema potamos]|jgi:MFS family permease
MFRSSFFFLVITTPLLLLIATFSRNEQHIICSNFAVEAFSIVHTSSSSSRTLPPKRKSMHHPFRHDTGNKASAYDRVKTNTFGFDDVDSLQSQQQHQSALTTLRSAPTDRQEDGAEAEAASSSSLQDISIIVFPLLLIYISNQWSRYSISYLVDFSPENAAATFTAMNVDLQFTKSQYGLLASTAFTILFAFSSLIAGSLADKYDRKLLTLSSCLVWTVATMAQSQAHTYNEVLIARIVMGGACAFAAPAAYTLIADKISKDKLAFANSLYGSGVYLGGALASLSLLLDENVGWRWTLGAIGGFGVAAAIVASILLPSDGERNIFTESHSGGEDDDASRTMQQLDGEENNLFSSATQIVSIPRVQFIYLASFLRFCSGLMIGVWAAPYFKQAFPDDATQYAVVNAFIVGGMGMTSGIMGGYFADGLGRWVKNEGEASSSATAGVTSILRENFDEETIRLLLPIVGSLLAIPAWYQATHAGTNFEASMFWLAVEYLVAECWFGPTIAVLQSSVGASRTGTAQGLFVLTGAFANSAPTLLGWIYGSKVIDATTSSSEVLASLLSVGVCAGYLLSSVFFLISASASANGGLQRVSQNTKEGE